MRPHAGDRWQRPERGRTRSRGGRRRDTPLLPSGLQGRERINVSSHLLRVSAALGAERDAQMQTRPDRCPRAGKSDVTESRAAVQLPGWLGEPGTCRGWMNGSTDVRAAGTKVTAGEACPAPGEAYGRVRKGGGGLQRRQKTGTVCEE